MTLHWNSFKPIHPRLVSSPSLYFLEGGGHSKKDQRNTRTGMPEGADPFCVWLLMI